MHIRPRQRRATSGHSGRGPALTPVASGEWLDPVRAPTISRPIAWATIVTISAITATLLTLTSSEAQTPHAPWPGDLTSPVASEAPSLTAGEAIVEFDFEDEDGERPLDGWSGAGTASLDVVDSVAFRGDRSLRIQPDPPRDRRYVEARVSVAGVVGGRSLRGAQISCRLRPGTARQVPDVRAGLVIEDGTTGADFGSEVPLRGADDEWVELSLTVGDRGEDGVDGGTVYQSPQFDHTDVTTLAVYLEAPRGALTEAVHVDSCVIDTTADARPTRADRAAAPDRADDEVYVPSLPPLPEQEPEPPATPERESAEEGDADDQVPGPAAPPPPLGEILLHDFEDPGDPLDDLAADGTAALSIDDSTAVHGERSLRIAPDPAGVDTSIETRIALAGRLPDAALAGARVSCQVRPDTQVAAAGASAGLIVEDAGGGQDHGAQVTLRDGRWTEVTLVIGERGEAGRDGGVVPQSEGFDADSLTTLRMRVDADGPLTAPVHLDHCTITVG